MYNSNLPQQSKMLNQLPITEQKANDAVDS